MKNFFTSFFAALSALVVFCLAGVVMLFIVLGAIAALGNKPVLVPQGAYLVVDLGLAVQDTPVQMEEFDELMGAFGGGAGERIQLRRLTRAIEAAAQDPDIAGILLRGGPTGAPSGFAPLREVRASLETFKKSGKPVKAYLTYATTREFYLASVANEVTLDPFGGILMPGLASQPMFFARAFEKFGVGVQVTRVGKYKSAVEPFTRENMSAENRAQVQKLLDDIWTDLVTGVEAGRSLEAGTLQRLADTGGIVRAQAALDAKLVDRVAYWDAQLDDLKQATGLTGARETFKQIDVKSYAKLVGTDGLVAVRRGGSVKVEPGARGKIGIVYAEGEIVDGDGHDEGVVYGDKVAREIRQLRLDDGVKAIVVRVNSPGGSASASETIQREVRLAREKKPVIISMGHLAASGGYWISTYGTRVFAEPTTITGSIGVFGMFLNFQGLMNDKLGLTFDSVKTGRFADMLSAVRPKTEEELAVFQKMVDWIYEEFTGKVAESRKLDLATVKEIAQGRVWSGTEAVKLGLVDELGGLSAAISYAAKEAKLSDNFRIVELPRAKPFGEMLNEALAGKRHEQASSSAIELLVQRTRQQLETLTRYNDPRGVYARMPFDLAID